MFEIYNFGYNNENIINIFNTYIKLDFYLKDNIIEVLKNYYNPDLEKYKPKDGYEFIVKSNYNEGIGIYHSHLCKMDGKIWVLVWYIKENKNNYYEIIFEVMIHPSDDYKQILSDIKSDPLTINPNTWANFLEKFKILKYSEFNYFSYKYFCISGNNFKG